MTETDRIVEHIKNKAPLNESEIIKQLITDDKASAEYQAAIMANQYYSGKQAIMRHDFTKSRVLDRVYDEAEQQEKEKFTDFSNPNRSNMRLQHRFLYAHVEQKVNYITGCEPSVTVDGAEANESGNGGNDEWQYQNLLAKTTNAEFRRQLLDWQRRAALGGVAWLHEYKDKRGVLCSLVVPRYEGVPIYDTANNKELVGFIRHYEIEQKEGKGNSVKVCRAEWWTPTNVTYYISDSRGDFKLDSSVPINPAPHYWTVTYRTGADGVTLEEVARKGQSWGEVPFVELANNSDRMTDLAPYKDLIDAYDAVASKGTNNLMDFNEFFAIVQGLGGDAASSIVKKLDINRAVSVGANGGNIELKQLDLQMQGRIEWLRLLWDSIHFFGQAVDPTKESVGQAASGVALEFQYSLLDLKANNMITEAERSLVKHFWFITEDANRQQGTKYESAKVAVQFNKSRIVNNLETVQMIVASEQIVPEKILLQAHPLVKDADQAYKDLLAERDKKGSSNDFGTDNAKAREKPTDQA